MAKKPPFRRHSVPQIKKLETLLVKNPQNLSHKIVGLNEGEGLRLELDIVPEHFRQDSYGASQSSARASRLNYKYGDIIELTQPHTQNDAFNARHYPYQFRARDLELLTEIAEEDINVVGYSYEPVQGRDRRIVIVPFQVLLEGAKVYSAFAARRKQIELGEEFIDVDIRYIRSSDVRFHGASIPVTVPSTTEGSEPYHFTWDSVPIIDTMHKRAIAYGLKPSDSLDPVTGEPVKGSTLRSKYNIRYPGSKVSRKSRRVQDAVYLDKHHVAGYLALIDAVIRERNNKRPLEMSLLGIPSQFLARQYTKLDNNIIIFDDTLSGKETWRHLHIDEKSILLARIIGQYMHKNPLFADPKKDGRKVRDYDWNPS